MIKDNNKYYTGKQVNERSYCPRHIVISICASFAKKMNGNCWTGRQTERQMDSNKAICLPSFKGVLKNMSSFKV